MKTNTSGNNPINIRIEEDTNITANINPLQATPLSKWAIVQKIAMTTAFLAFKSRIYLPCCILSEK